MQQYLEVSIPCNLSTVGYSEAQQDCLSPQQADSYPTLAGTSRRDRPALRGDARTVQQCQRPHAVGAVSMHRSREHAANINPVAALGGLRGRCQPASARALF